MEPTQQLRTIDSPGAVDKPELESLFEEEEGHLVRFAFGFVRRREIAEELVQEAFLRLHRHWEGVDTPRAWIYRAVRNLCLSWIRDHKRETVVDGSEAGRSLEAEHGRPDEVVGKLEAAGMVRVFMAELPEMDREILRLKYTEGMKYAAIAAETGLSVGNVGYRLHHLLRGLATSLRQVGVSGSAG